MVSNGNIDDAAAARAVRALDNRSVVLVGMMGVGKTSVGKRLAARLDLPFVDADHAIEEAAGMTVADIFARFGEAYFRDGEKRVIARLIEGPPCVIATGGGAFVAGGTRDLILAHAVSIWLDAPIDTLVKRVSRRGNRPLLHGKDPKKVLTELAQVRNPFYAMADHHILSEDAPHEVMVDRIIKAIGT